MECIEKNFPCAAEFNLDTPCWNERTNAFYKKLGYRIIKVEDGFVFYRKKKSEQTQQQISSPNGRQKHERNMETATARFSVAHKRAVHYTEFTAMVELAFEFGAGKA